MLRGSICNRNVLFTIFRLPYLTQMILLALANLHALDVGIILAVLTVILGFALYMRRFTKNVLPIFCLRTGVLDATC